MEESLQEKVAHGLYSHDAAVIPSGNTWWPWAKATKHKRQRYLARAAVAIKIVQESQK